MIPTREQQRTKKNGAPWPPRCRHRHRLHPASRWHGNPARGWVSSSFVHNYRVVPSRCVGVVRNGGCLALPATVNTYASPNLCRQFCTPPRCQGAVMSSHQGECAGALPLPLLRNAVYFAGTSVGAWQGAPWVACVGGRRGRSCWPKLQTPPMLMLKPSPARLLFSPKPALFLPSRLPLSCSLYASRCAWPDVPAPSRKGCVAVGRQHAAHLIKDFCVACAGGRR